MLMYGKEARNQKQEIGRQHHTIPNQRKQRLKDKHYGNVHNRLWNPPHFCIFLLHQYVRNECTVCLLFYQGNSDKWDCRYSINRLLAIGRLCVSLYPIAIVR